jgi:hypothetical protein
MPGAGRDSSVGREEPQLKRSRKKGHDKDSETQGNTMRTSQAKPGVLKFLCVSDSCGKMPPAVNAMKDPSGKKRQTRNQMSPAMIPCPSKAVPRPALKRKKPVMPQIGGRTTTKINPEIFTVVLFSTSKSKAITEMILIKTSVGRRWGRSGRRAGRDRRNRKRRIGIRPSISILKGGGSIGNMVCCR